MYLAEVGNVNSSLVFQVTKIVDWPYRLALLCYNLACANAQKLCYAWDMLRPFLTGTQLLLEGMLWWYVQGYVSGCVSAWPKQPKSKGFRSGGFTGLLPASFFVCSFFWFRLWLPCSSFLGCPCAWFEAAASCSKSSSAFCICAACSVAQWRGTDPGGMSWHCSIQWACVTEVLDSFRCVVPKSADGCGIKEEIWKDQQICLASKKLG